MIVVAAVEIGECQWHVVKSVLSFCMSFLFTVDSEKYWKANYFG